MGLVFALLGVKEIFMEKLLIKIFMGLVLGPLALSVSQASDLSLYEVVKPLSPVSADMLSEKQRNVVLENVTAGPRGLAFKYRGVSFQLVVNDLKTQSLNLNGDLFTSHDLKNQKTIRMALLKKMGVSPDRAASVWNLLFTQAFAQQQPIDATYSSYDLLPMRSQSNPIGLDTLKEMFSRENMSEMTDILSTLLTAVNEFAFNNPVFDQAFSMPNPESIPKPSFMTQ